MSATQSRYATPVSLRLPSPKRRHGSTGRSASASRSRTTHNDSAAAAAAAATTSPSRHSHHRAHEPRSPSREEENRIRRGAEIIRRQIQLQLGEMGELMGQKQAEAEQEDFPAIETSSSLQRRVSPKHSNSLNEKTARRKENNRPWKEEFAWKAPSVRKDPPTSGGIASKEARQPLDGEDESSVGEFSDPWSESNKMAGKATSPIGTTGKADDPTEPATESSSSSTSSRDMVIPKGSVPFDDKRNERQPRMSKRDPSPIPFEDGPHAAITRKSIPIEATPEPPVCFLSSDEEDDDNDNDIMEVKEPMFDSFYEQDLLPVEKNVKALAEQKVASLNAPVALQRNSPAAVSPSVRPSSPAVFGDAVFTYQEGRQAVVVVPPDRPPTPPVDGESSGGSSTTSGPMYPQQQNITVNVPATEQGLNNAISNDEVEVSYRLPRYLESPEKEKGSLKLPEASLVDYDDDEAEGQYPVNAITVADRDGNYESPAKGERPVLEVPLQSPGNVSMLSTPEKTTKLAQPSAFWKTFDDLLRDPAYLHAQSAGFVWQSIVGQHVQFPSKWWNGARGPPIGEDGLPWIYFGRHTVKDNRVLNQLVKGRASAGRILLHVVVQDLLTRAPVQDIAIGCFHPNAKGIRIGEQALKRLEDCRDVWMSIRKRSRQSVSATDSLLYSQSNWDGHHSMCRSPLGPGQRVTNSNVRCVFGDKPPLETIFLSEDELYERLSSRIKQVTVDGAVSPPMAILQEFVFA